MFDNFIPTVNPDNRFVFIDNHKPDFIIIGATCKHIFNLPFKYSEFSGNNYNEMRVYYKHGLDVIVEKSPLNCVITEYEKHTIIEATLQPSETRLFSDDSLDTLVQLKLVNSQGEVIFNKPEKLIVKESFENTHMDDIIINGYVTPEDFGAIGDGISDDTIAIQNAINSGHNVMFNCEKKYLLTDTLVVDKLTNRVGHTIFSNTRTLWSPQSQFIFDFKDSTKPVFLIKTDGITLWNISIFGTNTDDVWLDLVHTDTSAVDIDLTIEECSIYRVNAVVKADGRGINILNNMIASFSSMLNLSFTDREGGGSYHDFNTGMRSIRIDGNRIHSIQSPAKPLITINSGNAIGMQFINNHIDRGESSLIQAYSRGYHWQIENNIFHGMGGSVSTNNMFIRLSEGISGLQICNNSFITDIGGYITRCIIHSDGDIDQLVFTNNTLENYKTPKGIDKTTRSTIELERGAHLTDSVISGNILFVDVSSSDTTRGIIGTYEDIERVIITNNIVKNGRALIFVRARGEGDYNFNIKDCIITDNITTNIYARGDSAHQAVIYDNTVRPIEQTFVTPEGNVTLTINGK